MKILFLNHNYENFGTFYRCYFLGKYLARRGHEIDIVCASRKNFDLKIKSRIVEPNFRIVTLPRIRLHEYHTGHLLRALINSGLVMVKNYDILHSFAVAQPATAVPTVIASYLRNKPIVVDWDDAWEGGLADQHPSLIGRVISYLEREVPKLADTVTVVSSFLKDVSEKRGYKNVVKIPNGANVDDIKPLEKESAREFLNIPQDINMMLSIGHTYTKSINLMLEAFTMALQRMPDLKLYIVGNFGRQGEDIKKIFSAAKDNITFTGEQPFERVKLYLAAADCLVMPMENSVFEKARFPIRLGDYMAAGRPIISNAVGEVKDVLSRGCGIICLPDDVKGFSDIMVRIIEDKRLQREISGKARAMADAEYAWGILAQDLESVYKKLLSNTSVN